LPLEKITDFFIDFCPNFQIDSNLTLVDRRFLLCDASSLRDDNPLFFGILFKSLQISSHHLGKILLKLIEIE
jgi:hypothetical protein